MFSGIVLAGGKSIRMGADKRFLEFNNKTLLDNSIESLKGLTSEVIVVFSSKENTENTEGIKTVYDHIKGIGPLAGIYSGLSSCKTDYALVTAVDTPFLNKRFLKYMMENVLDHDAVIPSWSRGIEPLIGVYSTKLVSLLKKHMESGRRLAPHQFIKNLEKVRYIEENEIIEFGKPEKLFHNINNPVDLKTAKDML